MTYAYIRVSSKEQSLNRQIDAVRQFRPNIAEENIFADKQSGKSFERRKYLELKSVLKPGDELIIKELDRLGRNKQGIKEELEWFRANKIIVRILNVPTTLIEVEGQEWIFEMINNILIEVMASVAEEERVKIQGRREEGIAAAKARGEYHPGRPAIEVEDLSSYKKAIVEGKMTVKEAAKELGISRRSWYNLMERTA